MADSTPDLQPHLKCAKGDVARYVFVPGDQDRALAISRHFQCCRTVSKHRAYHLFTGAYRGVEMSVCSTGIGCPSAAIALEELAKCGADTFIRVGSAGSWQRDVEPGSLVIATGALRRDGTSTRYAPLGFPAIAHGAVVSSLSEASSAFKVPVRSGVVLCDDAFYGPLEKEYIEQVESLGVLAVEMETSVLFTLGTIRGWRTGAILAIDGSIIQGRIKDPSAADAFKRAEAAALEAALLAMHRIASADQRRS